MQVIFDRIGKKILFGGLWDTLAPSEGQQAKCDGAEDQEWNILEQMEGQWSQVFKVLAAY